MCHTGRSRDESQKEPGADLGTEVATERMFESWSLGGKKSTGPQARKLAVLSHKALQPLAAAKVSHSEADLYQLSLAEPAQFLGGSALPWPLCPVHHLHQA